MNASDLHDIWTLVRTGACCASGSVIACWIQRKELNTLLSKFMFFFIGSVFAGATTPVVMEKGEFPDLYLPIVALVMGVSLATIITGLVRGFWNIKWNEHADRAIERATDRIIKKRENHQDG